MSEAKENDVEHREADRRFEVNTEGETAVLGYRRENDLLYIDHTRVPQSLGGRGVGSSLVREALDWAREENLAVVPNCSFAAAYIERHPEYQDLLQEGA